MLDKFTSNASDLSDTGEIIDMDEYKSAESERYIFSEDSEKIYFLIKSKSSEYCFTNNALIHIDGITSASKRRSVCRYEYCFHRISFVTLEIPGNTKLDAEIKFTIGPKKLSINVIKNQLDKLKSLYKILIKISEIQRENHISLSKSEESLERAVQSISSTRNSDISLSKELKEINEYIFNWFIDNREEYIIKDFGSIFERYMDD